MRIENQSHDRAENQSHDKEDFLNWRREIGTSAMHLLENAGKLCGQAAKGRYWGESALEALLYLTGSTQVQVRLTAYEAIIGLLEIPGAVSTSARTLILWALEDALRDNDTWISRLARIALRQHLMEELAQAHRLFPGLLAYGQEERAAAFRALRSLPVPLISQVYHSDADQFTDCLGLCKLPVLPSVLDRDACLVTCGKAGEAETLKTFLGGLATASRKNQISIAVVTSDETCRDVAAQHEARLIPAEATSSDAAPDVHGLLFSIARTINTEKYLCVQPNFSNYRFLWTLWDSLNALDENSLVVCPESSSSFPSSPYYDPPEAETVRVEGIQLTPNCSALSPVLFAGHRNALLALDAAIRHLLPFVPKPVIDSNAALFSLAASTNERMLPLNARQIR